MDQAALREMAERVTCASVVDALGRRHPHRAYVLGLVSPRPGVLLFGRAATLGFLPNRADRPARDFGELAMEAAAAGPEGTVLVVASAGHPDEAVAGGRKLAQLDHAGFGGMLADARIRDFAEVAGYRMAVYCRGETPRASGERVSPHEAGVPVVVGGVTVVPGDWVYADGSGAAVVPAADIEGVLADAALIEERDAAAVARIRAGEG